MWYLARLKIGQKQDVMTFLDLHKTAAMPALPTVTQFPIFVDVGTRAPLVVGGNVGGGNVGGGDDGLVAKIRLLLKFAPQVDVVVPKTASSGAAEMRYKISDRVNIIAILDSGVEPLAAQIDGRPLVIIETSDPALNEALSDYAKSRGVPVNVPDTLHLCSFYLGSLVDRGPVTIAISTNGLAPVLGQNIRAKLEDMLHPRLGDVAVYLRELRTRLRHLPAAMRRSLQHQIIEGPVARFVMSDRVQQADSAVLELLSGSREKPSGSISLVEAGAGDTNMLSLGAVAAIRGADTIIYDRSVSPNILDLARREVDLVGGFGKAAEHLGAILEQAKMDGHRVIYLIGGDPANHQGAEALRYVLHNRGIDADYIASASAHRQQWAPSSDPLAETQISAASGRIIRGVFA
ncbi:SAM-dependent methyltransferase [Alphaproteobacteria bacterium]|nr:SAM-dependent methyltransferase [Alphaproteobacteria bacterium]